MKSSLPVALLFVAALISSTQGWACDAYFPFDGSLADRSGGNNGTMFAAEGAAATATFAEGVVGQALKLEGASAMRADLDLSYEVCPQITITAWIRVEANEVPGWNHIVSTGSGSGPNLRTGSKTLNLTASGNGISQKEAFRDPRAWFFVAAVFDYDAGFYRFHWRDRVIEAKIPEKRRVPESALWVGAYNDRLMYPIGGAYIDELRVIGRVLDKDEIARMRGGRPAAFVQVEGGDVVKSASTDSSSEALLPAPVVVAGSDGVQDPDLTIKDDVGDVPGPVAAGGLLVGPSLESTPEGVTPTGQRVVDPELTPLEDDPATRMQKDLEAQQEAGLETVLGEMIEEGERNFGPRNRTQVALERNGELAYAGTPDELLVADEDLAYNFPPGSGANYREVFRFKGTNAFMILHSNGITQVIGNAGGRQSAVKTRIDAIFNNGRTVDLIASNDRGYLLVSGTNVFSKDVPAAATAWARSELEDGLQVTALAFLPGDAWIGVSRRGAQAGGLDRSHWGMDLLTDVNRLINAGEEIHDISVTGSLDGPGIWAIATDRQIYYHQTPAGSKRFPDCRKYQESNDDYYPWAGSQPEFGQRIEDEIGRDWSCWYPKRNCLAHFPTWSESDMGSPADDDTWLVNLMVTIAVPSYEGLEKEIFDCWLDDQLRKAEDVFRHKPALEFRLRTEYKKTKGGNDLVFYTQESQSAHKSFMDANFDVMAKSKTEGYYPILVSHYPCVGYADGERKCQISKASFPHFVRPDQRKHGILLFAEVPFQDTLAHEFGHYLSLRHTFEAYVNLDPDLNCNTRYNPKGDDGHCNSCLSPSTVDPQDGCTGTYNVMDYCWGDPDNADLNNCQQSRAVNQRQRYLTNDGRTKYTKMKGRLGEPYCTADSHCLDDEFCDTGVLTIGRNVCKNKRSSGAGCTRGGQCDSGKCPFLFCK